MKEDIVIVWRLAVIAILTAVTELEMTEISMMAEIILSVIMVMVTLTSCFTVTISTQSRSKIHNTHKAVGTLKPRGMTY